MKNGILFFGLFNLLTLTLAGHSETHERHFSFSDDIDWDSPIQLAYELDSSSNKAEGDLGDYHNDPDTAIALIDEVKAEHPKSPAAK